MSSPEFRWGGPFDPRPLSWLARKAITILEEYTIAHHKLMFGFPPGPLSEEPNAPTELTEIDMHDLRALNADLVTPQDIARARS